MDDRNMRLRILRVLEVIDFEERERWARRIICSSLGATALALGMLGCLPPGPTPSRGEPAPIAQPDLGGCPNCEYAAPMPILPIDNGPRPKYAADIDQTPRPAYAVVYPLQPAEPRYIPVALYSADEPRPLPQAIAVPPSNAEYAAPFEREPNLGPTLKYGVHAPQALPNANDEACCPKYGFLPDRPAATSAPAVIKPKHEAVARYAIAFPRE